MTSSLRNSIHRRNHKERSQPTNRAKYGLLEKHKDYVKRARDYHSKQDRLTRLKQKAAERNKDEFYFRMNKETTKGGIHVKDRGNVALPTDLVKVLKTQDENYIRTMRLAGLKKIDKLKAQLTSLVNLVKNASQIDTSDLDNREISTLREAGILPSSSKSGSSKASHVTFVESEEDAKRWSQNSGSNNDDDGIMLLGPTEAEEMDLGWKVPEKKKKNKQRVVSGGEAHIDDGDERHTESEGNLQEPALLRQRLLKELAARLERDKHLRYAQREFEMQRLLMNKGRRQKIAGPERIRDDDDNGSGEDDEDALDARGGRPRKGSKKAPPSMESFKPRVYKWKVERKR